MCWCAVPPLPPREKTTLFGGSGDLRWFLSVPEPPRGALPFVPLRTPFMSVCPHKSPISLLLLLGLIPPCRFNDLSKKKRLKKTPKTQQILPNPGEGGSSQPRHKARRRSSLPPQLLEPSRSDLGHLKVQVQGEGIREASGAGMGTAAEGRRHSERLLLGGWRRGVVWKS